MTKTCLDSSIPARVVYITLTSQCGTGLDGLHKAVLFVTFLKIMALAGKIHPRDDFVELSVFPEKGDTVTNVCDSS